MLQCYASGDGALHFTHVEMPNSQNGYNHMATSRPITKKDVKEYVASLPAHHDLKKWWIVQVNGTHWNLVHPVERINENTLLMDGIEFKYALDPDIKWPSFKSVSSKLTWREDEEGVEVQEWSVVRNVNMLGALIFFIRNEERLAQLVKVT